MAQASANISKKRKHVAEGVFKAELDGYLRKVSFCFLLNVQPFYHYMCRSVY